MDLLVAAAADVCIDKDKTMISNDIFIEGLAKMGFDRLIPEVKKTGDEIESNIKEKNESWKNSSKEFNKMTYEESVRLQNQIHEQALLELKKKRQAEAAAKALKGETENK